MFFKIGLHSNADAFLRILQNFWEQPFFSRTTPVAASEIPIY